MNKFRLPLVAFFLFASLPGFAASLLEHQEMPVGRGAEMHKRLFKLYGHRGARGLMPESTLAGYAKALEIGVDMVDMDVVMTRDHVVVVYHDLALNPDTTRDAQGRWVQPGRFINQMTYAELRTYDVGRINPASTYATYFPDQVPVDGASIPTLLEVIDFVQSKVGNRVGFQIEIKDDPEHPEQAHTPSEVAREIAKILQHKHIIERTEVQAFNWQCLLELQRINTHIATAFLTDPESEVRMRDANPKVAGTWTGGYQLSDYAYSLSKMIKALGGAIWGPQDIEVTGKNLQAAHEAGLKVVTWSMPSAAGRDVDLEITQKLINMGVDGIITDRPDKVALLHKF